MVTIVMKEVADSNNILAQNRASCRMYINGVKLLDKKVETKYVNKIYSATFKNNSSPFYVNPLISDIKTVSPYHKVTTGNVLKMCRRGQHAHHGGRLWSAGHCKAGYLAPRHLLARWRAAAVKPLRPPRCDAGGAATKAGPRSAPLAPWSRR